MIRRKCRHIDIVSLPPQLEQKTAFFRKRAMGLRIKQVDMIATMNAFKNILASTMTYQYVNLRIRVLLAKHPQRWDEQNRTKTATQRAR